MKDQYIVVQIEKLYYIFLTGNFPNPRSVVIRSPVKFKIIKPNELFNYFVINGDKYSKKIDVNSCGKLFLREISREQLEIDKNLVGTGELHSLEKPETFDWLIYHGAEIHTNITVLLAWAALQKNEKLINYFCEKVIEKASTREIVADVLQKSADEISSTITDIPQESVDKIQDVKKVTTEPIIEISSPMKESIIRSFNKIVTDNSFSSEEQLYVSNMLIGIIQNNDISITIRESCVYSMSVISQSPRLTLEQRKPILHFLMTLVHTNIAKNPVR